MHKSKVCPECKQEKPASEFNTRKGARGKVYLASYCKPCMSARATAHQKANYTAEEWTARMVAYRKTPNGALSWFKTKAKRLGLSDEEVAKAVASYEAHNGCCEICKQPLKNTYIDHCHETMTFRGLLCGLCNSMLGYAKDHPEVLRSGALYLENSRRSL